MRAYTQSTHISPVCKKKTQPPTHSNLTHARVPHLHIYTHKLYRLLYRMLCESVLVGRLHAAHSIRALECGVTGTSIVRTHSRATSRTRGTFETPQTRDRARAEGFYVHSACDAARLFAGLGGASVAFGGGLGIWYAPQRAVVRSWGGDDDDDGIV